MAIEVVSLPCLDQKMISPSSQAVARRAPLGDQSTARTRLECAVMVVVLQVAVSQIRTVRSEPAVARQPPSGDQATAFTSPVWLVRLVMMFPMAGSQIRTVWSVPALARWAPSGDLWGARTRAWVADQR
jgi:hypothetical protein